MTLTIEMTPEIEQQLRQAAQAAGLSPDAYALQLIHNSLSAETFSTETFSTEIHNGGSASASLAGHLSKAEAELIETINTSLASIDWPRYQALVEKRQDETLSAGEYEVLVALTNQLEKANVDRLEAIATLAQLRNTSVDAVIDSLDLQAKKYI